MATELAKAYVQIVPSAEGIKGKLSEALGGEANDAGKKGGERAGHSFGATIKKIIIAAGIGKVIKDAITEGANYEQLEGGVTKLFSASQEAIAATQKEMFAHGAALEDVINKTHAMATANELVMKNAQEAYRTAGMSANEYMKTVTNFSASLVSGLGGDTEKAAKIADVAIRDMSDNANTFGSDIQSIQNAYQGFAKGNYTMLDNLKLGYGGTKEEMLRLVKEAGVVEDSVESIDNVSFDQIIEGIHITQERLKITGTTANEAASTFSGSLSTMQAAWKNLLTGIASGQDVSGMIDGLVQSISDFAANAIPMIGNVLTGLLPALTQVLVSLGPTLVNDLLPMVLDVVMQLVNSLVTVLPTIIPQIVQLAVDVINALTAALPTILPVLIPAVLQGLIDIGLALVKNLPLLLASIFECFVQISQILGELFVGLWNDTILPWLSDVFSSVGEWFSGIISSIGEWFSGIFASIGQFFSNAWQSIGQWFSNIIQKVVGFFTGIWQKYNETRSNVLSAVGQFFSNIWQSITSWFSRMIQKVVTFVTSIPQKIRDGFSRVTQAGLDLVKGLWNGISNATQWVLDKIRGFGKSILNGIKKIFGIGSPSKEMAYFGEMLDAGLAQGIEGNTRPISNAIDDITSMTTKGFGADLGVNTSMDVNHTSAGMAQLVQLVAALSDKIDKLQVYLDGDLLVGGISDRMDTALGVAGTYKARGLA
ncbi:MAG: hypothetical protein IKQ73_07550 [Oscillospiraceae bacterium]|nr:hypothetical protein [Oscillospiraceae bacterium]